MIIEEMRSLLNKQGIQNKSNLYIRSLLKSFYKYMFLILFI